MSVDISGMGEFWSHDDEDSERITGLLRLDEPEGGTRWILVLNRSLDGKKNTIQNMVDRFSLSHTVFGYSHGKPITLLDCKYVKSSHSLHSSEYLYAPKYIILGCHFDDSSEYSACEIEFSIPELPTFLNGPHGRSEISRLKVGNYNLEHESPEYSWNAGDYSLHLTLEAEVDRQENLTTLAEYGKFNVNRKTGQSMYEWDAKVLQPLVQVIQFASSRMVSVEKLWVNVESALVESDTYAKVSPNERKTVILNETLGEGAAQASSDWLLHARHLDDHHILKLMDLDQPFHTLKSGLTSIRTSPIDDNETLIQLARLLESFHRQIFPPKTEDIERYQKRVDTIIDTVSKYVPDELQLLSRQLRYGYEPSLEQRLRQLSAPWNDNFSEILGSSKGVNRLLASIGQHRNYLAHGLQHDAPPLSGFELFSANAYLRVLGQLWVLRTIGLSIEQSWARIQTTEHFDEWSSYLDDFSER